MRVIRALELSRATGILDLKLSEKGNTWRLTSFGSKCLGEPQLKLGLKRTDHIVRSLMLRTLGMVSRDMRWERRRMIKSVIAHSCSDLLVWIELGVVFFHFEGFLDRGLGEGFRG